ncbi:MAG: hypothetical protein ACRC62_28130 [Microcoleus sp.]
MGVVSLFCELLAILGFLKVFLEEVADRTRSPRSQLHPKSQIA